MVADGDYEQARGLREKHQKCDGDFEISASKTVNVPLDELFDAWQDETRRNLWLGEKITVRKATANKSMRITWSDGRTSVEVNFAAKGDEKSQAAVQHRKLADAREADRKKEYWTQKLDKLKTLLEGIT